METLSYADTKSQVRLQSPDSFVLAVAMTVTALCVGYAIDIKQGDYWPSALEWLSVGLGVCIAGIVLSKIALLEVACSRMLIILMLVGIVVETGVYLSEFLNPDPKILHWVHAVDMCVVVVAALGLLQAIPLRTALRISTILIMLLAFWVLGVIVFEKFAKDPGIDVFVFQQRGAEELMMGKNPYAMRFPNIYEPGTPFYGAGVVDPETHMLTYGFPYFPLSLLMILPGKLLGGDCRYADVTAVILSAGLMCLTRPGRHGAIAAALFLLTPRDFFVIFLAWTEPLLMLTFSLVIFCACRWRKMLPYALGLFFATKQYTILCLPAVFLLTESPKPLREIFIIIAKAALTAAVITVPFFLWNPHEFYRAVVQWQFVQPFRSDALSYLSWWLREFHADAMDPNLLTVPTWSPPVIVPLLAVAPAMALALWRCARSPAGFAAAVTLINFVFFAFNKQAFCNYYYFVIATACWTIAATRIQVVRQPQKTMPSSENIGLESKPVLDFRGLNSAGFEAK